MSTTPALLSCNVHSQVSAKVVLRDVLEQSAQTLLLYATLLRWITETSSVDPWGRLADPSLEPMRESLRPFLPKMCGPYLGLRERAALCLLIAQVRQDDEYDTALLLMEHLVLQIEPYLAASREDPDQRPHVTHVLQVLGLEHRPTEAVLAASLARRLRPYDVPLRSSLSALVQR